MAATAQLTMLNSMAGKDIAAAADRHVALGLKWLDLKDGLFGKGILALTDDEALALRRLADARGLGISCLSTPLFFGEIEMGREAFRAAHLARVDRAVAIARILRPRFIRLLAAATTHRSELCDSTPWLLAEYPWLFDAYREAIDRITSAGFAVAIENEIHGCIWSRPAEITGFFAALERPAARLIWDAQNLWQLGTYPNLEVYRALRPLISMVHLKGGRSERPGGPLKWSSAFADASWPIVDVVRAVVADGVSPVICLNPSHGEPKAGYDYTDIVARDIDFLRRNIPEIE